MGHPHLYLPVSNGEITTPQSIFGNVSYLVFPLPSFSLGTLRVNVVSVLIFSLLEATFLLLMIGEFSGSITISKMGGGAGIATGLAAFYGGAAQLLTEDNCWFTLPVGPIPRRRVD